MKTDTIVSTLAKESGLVKNDVSVVLREYSKFVVNTLKENTDERIPLPGIGTFFVKHVPDREGVITLGDKKGEKWSKPAHDEIKFTISNSVKEL